MKNKLTLAIDSSKKLRIINDSFSSADILFDLYWNSSLLTIKFQEKEYVFSISDLTTFSLNLDERFNTNSSKREILNSVRDLNSFLSFFFDFLSKVALTYPNKEIVNLVKTSCKVMLDPTITNFQYEFKKFSYTRSVS